ncbi:MAG: tRNA (N(6)-L-threonylcarbamoyladenosine(37)-C(2))-methylthiotransferase MtaB [Thermogutta sp.]
MPTLKTVTLGCKVNQYETEYLRQGFLQLGYRDAEENAPADLYIFNTCTVTHQADAECRKILRRLARENPAGEIIVMGCYATKAADRVRQFPGVSEVVTDKRRMAEVLAKRGLVHVPTGISQFARRHRAYVKVQDGCFLPCSYCIIPQVRPEVWSRPVPEIEDEVRRLIDSGYREVVLTGVHLGLFGHDRPRGERIDLAGLAERLIAVRDGFRIRLSSLEVNEVSDRLVALMTAYPDRVCPHLHIPLQSGSPDVLRRMRRRASMQYFFERCARVQEMLPLPAFSTDAMVGFPGETDADFDATCRAVERIGFVKVHVFRFSAREGTPAADMPDQVPEEIKRERARRLDETAQQSRRRYISRLLDKEVQVLLEDETDLTAPICPNCVLGMSDRYVPAALPAGDGKPGDLVSVRLTGWDGEFLHGSVLAADRCA